MDTAKKQLADRLKSANNVLVTVSRNPSVDQLASCLGLALLLNKQGKHTAAVFSGLVPSTIDFLQPEETLEKNTDSLRDFIIALDKSKADKLRYKVEDNVVRIFITPYKTSITDADLEFSQGDFNVDVVVALGVSVQEDLDEAITSHGRILHDATVASINTSGNGGLGSINWYDPQASSLSELVTELAQAIDPEVLDSQIATALLTGIVSETDRFGNDKTTSQTMNASATLMAAGANQQLVASKLEEAELPIAPRQEKGPSANPVNAQQNPDGMIEIDHTNDPPATAAPVNAIANKGQGFDLPGPNYDSVTAPFPPLPTNFAPLATTMPPAPMPPAPIPPAPIPPAPAAPAPQPFDNLTAPVGDAPGSHLSPGPKYIEGQPALSGTLTANTQEEPLESAVDPFSLPISEPPRLFGTKNDDAPTAPTGFTPPPPTWTPPSDPRPPLEVIQPTAPTQTNDAFDGEPSLAEIEDAVKRAEAEEAGLDTARDEVSRALTTAAATSQVSPEPIQALNAQPLGSSLHPAFPNTPVSEPLIGPAQALPQHSSLEEQVPAIAISPVSQASNVNAPPPVPPPIPFQFGNTPQ